MPVSTAPNPRSAAPPADRDRYASDRESSHHGHSIAPPCVSAAHVRGTVIDSPALRYLIDLDDDAWRRLGEVRVGDRLIVTENGELLRAEVIHDGARYLVRSNYPLHEQRVLVRRPFPEAA